MARSSHVDCSIDKDVAISLQLLAENFKVLRPRWHLGQVERVLLGTAACVIVLVHFIVPVTIWEGNRGN
jgi:hypothetical protein